MICGWVCKMSGETDKARAQYPVKKIPLQKLKETHQGELFYFQLLAIEHDFSTLVLFGKTKDGKSVCLHVHGYQPTFFIAVNPDDFEAQTALVKTLAQQTTHENGGKQIWIDEQPEEGDWDPLFYFHYITKPKFVKATCTSKTILRAFVTKLKENHIEPYENNLPYHLEFMIHKKMQGMCWVQCPYEKMQPITSDPMGYSRCQIEAKLPSLDFIQAIPNDHPEWQLQRAPFRTLSFDIECCGRPGIFPQPEVDPVIQIGCYLRTDGQPEEKWEGYIFVLGTCAPMPEKHNVKVLTYDSEKELLMSWRHFVVSTDPDMITGYNILNFDLEYLIKRAGALGIGYPFCKLGRSHKQVTFLKTKNFSSKAYGQYKLNDISMWGRIIFDCLPIIRREHKLRMYSLNFVSAHFLGQSKEDVHHSMIPVLHKQDEHGRKRLAIYCLKDSLLPLLLIDKLTLWVGYMEMTRVTGVLLEELIHRGQQIKVLMLLYYFAHEHHTLIPEESPEKTADTQDDTYEGATVIEPKTGYHQKPVITLDFASLYPSIMIAHNLCYSTLLPPVRQDLDEDLFTRVPITNSRFVKASERKGLLPSILEKLLQTRKDTKRAMKQEHDPFKQAMLNGRQLAYKICANSVYGFTGARVGKLPCMDISAGVTAFGRTMIEATKQHIETKYGGTVVYGDTDSVMIQFDHVHTVADAIKEGERLAPLVSEALFIPPIHLEFEKVYDPYLLLAKKRYAGLYWTRPDKFDKLDAKGIELVRRDNCKLTPNTMQKVLDYLMVEKDLDKAKQCVKDAVGKILRNEVDISELVISKSLSKPPDDYTKPGSKRKYASIAHVALAQRLAEKDPSSAPQSGDRVPYVMVQASKHVQQCERAEDPEYALLHKLPIDQQYYINKQLRQPLERLLGPVLSKQEFNELFSGEHTTSISHKVPDTAPLAKYFPRLYKCRSCKRTLEDGQEKLCEECKATDKGEEIIEQIEGKKQLYRRIYSHCQDCQQGEAKQLDIEELTKLVQQQSISSSSSSSSSTNRSIDVICRNRDCPVYYRRIQLKHELQ